MVRDDHAILSSDSLVESQDSVKERRPGFGSCRSFGSTVQYRTEQGISIIYSSNRRTGRPCVRTQVACMVHCSLISLAVISLIGPFPVFFVVDNIVASLR